MVRAQRLALTGPKERRVRCRQPASRLGVEAVEATGLAAIECPQVLREAAVGRVEVEEPGGRQRPESMHEAGWRRDECARADRVLLVVHEKGQLALEDVERINVLAVNVRRRAGPCLRVPRLRDRQIVERRPERDPAAEERLALAGPLNDSLRHACLQHEIQYCAGWGS